MKQAIRLRLIKSTSVFGIVNIRMSFLLILLSLLIIFYLELFLRIKSTYLPFDSDEYFYYLNAKSFFLYSSLKAALTFGGKGSILFGADAHGFAYPLLHGSIAKLVGWHNTNLIYFNFFLTLLIIVFYWYQNFLSIQQKIILSALFLLFPFIPIFIVTYMQEIIHIFFAVIASILIYKIYSTEKNKSYIIIFVVTLFIAAFFRCIWLFWLISLLPLAKTKKQFFGYMMLLLIGILISFCMDYFFYERTPNYFHAISFKIQNFHIISAIYSIGYHFLKNTLSLISYGYQLSFPTNVVYLILKYSIIYACGWYFYKFFYNRSKLNDAILLIGMVNFFFLMSLYDAFDWREIRILSPFFYFILLFIVLENKNFLFLILGCILSFFLSQSIINGFIKKRNEIVDQNFVAASNNFKKITNKISIQHPTILILSDMPPKPLDILNLPLATKYGFPIRYTIRFYDIYKAGDPKIDFIISFSKDNLTNYKKILSTNYYSLWIEKNNN